MCRGNCFERKVFVEVAETAPPPAAEPDVENCKGAIRVAMTGQA